MATYRTTLKAAGATLLLGAGAYLAITAHAIQGEGRSLAQSPLNNEAQVRSAFIMAVDDSGSMSYQLQFPAIDGRGCWNSSQESFFKSKGVLETSSGCSFYYAYTGPRSGTTYNGIPPVDTLGFARSPDYNPAYFDPNVEYLPWLDSEGQPYIRKEQEGNISPTAAPIDPRTPSVTINLTQQLFDKDNRSRFQTRDGMVIPPGVRYDRIGGSCGGLSNEGKGSNGNGTKVTGSCPVYIEYYPATFFLQEHTGSDPRPQPEFAPGSYSNVEREKINNACGNGCHLWKYTIGAEDTEAMQNFANWFSYYGNRNRSMIAALTRSMATVDNLRVGYFTINSGRSGSSYDSYQDVQMREMDRPEDRQALYQQMLALPASGNTPNLPAVKHLGAQFQRKGADAPIQLECQKNAGMLFTDGFSNIAATAPKLTGLGAPFDPTPANSMAAIASQYYFDKDGKSPLRPDMTAGQVPVPGACNDPEADRDSAAWRKLDCQPNQHMNFYGITLGARGEIFNPDLDQDPYVLNPSWPGYHSGQRSTIDDIWHATVNTRGEFINARSPADITAALQAVVGSVSASNSPSGSIAMTGARVGSGSLAVVPTYEATNDGADWFSRLTGYTVSVEGFGDIKMTEAWEASSKIPTASSRNIWFGDGNAVKTFTAGNVSLDALCNNSQPGMSRCSEVNLGFLATTGWFTARENAVEYLRGDQSLEVGRSGPEKLRFRTTRLGDIINSSPVISAPTDDYGYRSLPGSYADSYGEYLEEKRESRRPMVFAGANDGMLHGFDGGTGAQGGVERFAYIPRAVLGHMGGLLFPNGTDDTVYSFQHRFFVDGPLAVSDAWWNSSWGTVLVGSAGAGGRSVFALDISDSHRQTGGFDGSDRLWEIDDQHSSESVRRNIGHVLGQAVIVPVKANGTVSWKAIFGNGYRSVDGKAVLFVVDIDAGGGASGIKMIEAIEEGAPAGPNGLGNVVVLDRYRGDDLESAGRDGFADTVYAADLKGAIWRFDLRDLAGNEGLSEPVFVTATSDGDEGDEVRQPITGGLTVAAGPAGGVLIYFGTGSFVFQGDQLDRTSTQSLYAVLDRGGDDTLSRADLAEQEITGEANGARSMAASADNVGYGRGWYLDLPAGERFVGSPRLESGIIFMPTYAPSAALNAACGVDGGNWLYGLNALSGAPALSNVKVGSPTGTSPAEGTGAMALQTGGTAPVKDVAVMTHPRVPPLASGATPDDLADALAAQCSMIIQVAGAPPLYLPRACGRQSWRQVY